MGMTLMSSIGPSVLRGTTTRLSRALAVMTFMLLGAHPVHAQLTPRPSRDTTTHEYRGAYQRGFEQSWFAPCDAPRNDRMWWVTLTDAALLQRDSMLVALKAIPTDGLAVRWRATIGPTMPAGHMGRGTRYMLVTEILEIRPLAGAGFCGTRS